jgi:pimeloyl-ACP methyl ester carboxylesterase
VTGAPEDGPAGVSRHWLDVGGHHVHYLRTGEGPPVVLLHGGASDGRDWLATMTALADGFSCYAPDIIGFGQSQRHETGYFFSDFSDFVRDFAAALGLDGYCLVGHSFGARVALDTALENPGRVRKLVLIDAANLDKISRLGTALFTFFWALRKLLRKPQPYPRFLVREGEDYNYVSDDTLRQLRTPTLLVWKGRDPYMPVSIARRAERLMPAARLAVFPGYGHAPHKENTESFCHLLREFLEG